MVEAELNEGDKIINQDPLHGPEILTVDRVTKTRAMSGPFCFRRKYDRDSCCIVPMPTTRFYDLGRFKYGTPEKELLRLRAWNKELCKQLGSPCYARGTKQSCDHKVVEAADDLMSYLEKTVPQEVDLVGSDIGAAGLRDRLQRLATALKERGK